MGVGAGRAPVVLTRGTGTGARTGRALPTFPLGTGTGAGCTGSEVTSAAATDLGESDSKAKHRGSLVAWFVVTAASLMSTRSPFTQEETNTVAGDDCLKIVLC